MLAMKMKNGLLRLAQISFMVSLAFVGCMHTTDEKRKAEFEDRAEDRIEAMEKSIDELEQRQQEQLGGAPKQELTASIGLLQSKVEVAKAELNELKQRDATTWVEKQGSVNDALYEMDQAHHSALSIFEAH